MSLVIRLALVFFVTFLTVGLGGVLLGERILPKFIDFAGAYSHESSQISIPEILVASSTASSIKLKSESCLDPKEGEDFLLNAWFSIKRLPDPGERLVLFGKFERQSSAPRGYALALEHDGEAIRPVVYWYGGKGKSRWYNFSEVTILPGAWFMATLSFTQDKYLGLHFAFPRIKDKPEVRVLGGYSLEHAALPASETPLQFAGFGDRPLRGSVGPIGVFHKPRLETEIRKVVKQFAQSPQQIAAEFTSENVAFWSAQAQDSQSSCGVTVAKGRKHKAK